MTSICLFDDKTKSQVILIHLRSGDEARKCYRNLISTLGQTCTDIDTLVESALVLAGKGSGMDITSCIGE